MIKELALIHNLNDNDNIQKIELKTKLWPHQEKSSNEIFKNIIKLTKKGFGDASVVGSGKTLTALNLIKMLYEYNCDNKIYTHSGFLILLPTAKLYETWENEINKHTSRRTIMIY